MIISTNRKPAYDDFRRLMKRTDEYLNADAAIRPDYYRNRAGTTGTGPARKPRTT